ncbi:MAG: PIG-L family deacetylase [Bacteroidia bacterium]|nr:PIG-L family deacetylase [Bacteroidia bacterium]
MMLLRQILDRLRQRRLQLRARQLTDFAFDTLATVYPRPLEWRGPPQRVLVLTPHADDETFGAGGSMLLHADRGDTQHIILFSDNAASIDDTSLETREKVALREAEFDAASACVPGLRTTALRLGEKDFHENIPAPPAFVRQLVEFQPDVLYLPSLFDNHRDHRVLNIWLSRTLRTHKDVRPLIRGFEVWSPLPATVVADITSRVEDKKNMMRCYPSQLRAIDYEHHILGLNAYRAMTFGSTARFAEAFLELPSDAYLTLGNSVFHL